jgi:hypothetical protein
MDDLWLSLLPLIIASATVPIWIIIVLLLLGQTEGLAKAAALVGGLTVVRLVQGILFGLVIGNSPDAQAQADGGPSPLASTLFTILGVVLLVMAFRQYQTGDDPDAPPKWMTAVESITPAKAFMFGLVGLTLSLKCWVFTLSAIGVIRQSELSRIASVLTFLLFALLAVLLLLLLILLRAVAPQQTGGALKSATRWLEKNNRPITIAVGVIFGVLFLWNGITGLLS